MRQICSPIWPADTTLTKSLFWPFSQSKGKWSKAHLKLKDSHVRYNLNKKSSGQKYVLQLPFEKAMRTFWSTLISWIFQRASDWVFSSLFRGTKGREGGDPLLKLRLLYKTKMASIPFMAFSRETWCDFRVNRCATLLRIYVSSTSIVMLGMLYVG